ncbi:MAG TPA: DNA recombination protein RmuC [Pedococcus sp.]|nr:DNA recombination protein RmuC [Pedococcus sp.]
MEITTVTALAVGVLMGLLLGLALGWSYGVLHARRTAPTGQAALDASRRAELETRAADQAVVRESLERLHDQVRALDTSRVTWEAQLAQQVSDVRASTDQLRRETSALATALRKPQVRGRWGELHLRRAVELAGLVARCDFEEQVTTADGRQRPDLVVRLAGGRQIVVDAKVPLEGFLDAVECPDDQVDERAAHLARHARHLRAHVDALAAKAYWRALPGTPEFVVMFVPGESFLSAAMESDPSLLEYAAARKVVPASPTTLIALLRTVAHGWTEQAVNDQAREIHRLGRELHERLGTMLAHLDKVGRSLSGAVSAYNSTVGSLESRVMVSARRFSDLEVGGEELPPPQLVELSPRVPTTEELAELATPAEGIGPGVADAESA